MPGYKIFEESYLDSYREGGISPNENKIGLLDFLRELKSGAEAIPRLSSFMVVGIDEVLFQTSPGERERFSLTIHRTLQSAAQTLEKKKIEVQICCKGKLFKAESFWLEYRSDKIPLDTIFGTPTRLNIRGCPVYSVGFNLSS
jgi:hypothetical protein